MSTKTISGIHDLASYDAADIQPGMILLDGIVLAVEVQRHKVHIHLPSTSHAHDPHDKVRVYAQLDQASTAAVLREAGKHEGPHQGTQQQHAPLPIVRDPQIRASQ